MSKVLGRTVFTDEKRLPFEEEIVLALLHTMDPKEPLSLQRNMKLIAKLAVHFPSLVKDLYNMQKQWRDSLYARVSLQNLSQTATSFWCELLRIKDGNNHAKFDTLSKFMCDLPALPLLCMCLEDGLSG